MGKYSTLSELFTAIADAIRTKTGGGAAIVAENFPTEIKNIPTGGGVNPSDATATANDILAGMTAYTAEGKTTGTLQIKIGSIELTKAITASSYVTVSHDLGTVPSIILAYVENDPIFDSTTTYNIVSGYAINFPTGLVPGVGASKSAANCINSQGGGQGDTTSNTSTVCICDQITATTFRLRASGSSRCWSSDAIVKYIVMAL